MCAIASDAQLYDRLRKAGMQHVEVNLGHKHIESSLLRIFKK
jgi:hypothetical protein